MNIFDLQARTMEHRLSFDLFSSDAIAGPFEDLKGVTVLVTEHAGYSGFCITPTTLAILK